MDANRCPCIKRSQHRPQLESVLDNAKNVRHINACCGCATIGSALPRLALKCSLCLGGRRRSLDR
jgi:hypothetical protein